MSMLLEVKNLGICLHQQKNCLQAVEGLDFSMAAGQSLGIVGESGCGKSLTALAVMQLLARPQLQINSGSICFKGENLLQADNRRLCQLRGKSISMIFQEPMTALNPVLSIQRQLCEVLELHLGMKAKQARLRALELLASVGFERPQQVLQQYPHQLSGGMRQRVMIAMAISCQPELIVADEPTTALDASVKRQILELLQNYCAESNAALLLISHDLSMVRDYTANTLVMYAGRVVEQAASKQLFASPLHAYSKLLLSALPRHAAMPKQPLKTIPNQVAPLHEYIDGCRFCQRMGYPDHLNLQRPRLIQLSPGRLLQDCPRCRGTHWLE